MFCFWNLWSNIVMSTELLSSHVQAMLNICQCRACFSYCILFFFYRCRISQILQCAFMWRATEKAVIHYNFQSCFTGSIGPTLCVYVYILLSFTGFCNIHLTGHLYLHLIVLKDLACMFLMTTENWETSYLIMKPEKKHKINVYIWIQSWGYEASL